MGCVCEVEYVCEVVCVMCGVVGSTICKLIFVLNGSLTHSLIHLHTHRVQDTGMRTLCAPRCYVWEEMQCTTDTSSSSTPAQVCAVCLHVCVCDRVCVVCVYMYASAQVECGCV